jgi:hypothetical protein
MNVLDLDVYITVLYIVCAMCRFCNSSSAGYTVFCKKIIAVTSHSLKGRSVQTRIIMGCHYRINDA